MLVGDARAEAERIIAKYPNSRSATLPLLFLVQSVEGYVTEEGMREVAELLGLTPAQVLASASFYTMLKRRPTGEYLVSVCRNISCTHRGARKIIKDLADHLGVGVGETTADGRFTLEAAECLATCDGAPSMQVNYEDFYDLDTDTAIQIVEKLRRGDDVRGVRGDPIRSHREVSHETATAGVLLPDAPEELPTVGGESGSTQMVEGFRPKERGDQGGDGDA